MITPSELVVHYSTKAFQTRLAALTFVGAILATDVVWKPEFLQREVLGIALILVVGSLAGLNSRYTYSYLCACIASSRPDASQMWRDFKIMNEGPYSSRKDKVRKKKRGAFVSPFLLSWATYVPGLAAGLYLALPKDYPLEVSKFSPRTYLAILLAIALSIWWLAQTRWTYKPEDFL